MSEPTTAPYVVSARDGAVARLTLNRGAGRNALGLPMIAALRSALAAAGADDAARVVVIAADGPAFCAGHDLKEMTARRADPDKGEAYFRNLFEACAALMQAIVTLPKPVIAQVHGVATAAGCQLVASCDLAVAASDARFATPGVNIGLFCSTPMVALSRNVGRKGAMEMLLTGEMVDAAEARRLGLINRIAAPQALEAETTALARLIAEKPRGALKIGKEAFYRQVELPLDAAYAYAAGVMTGNMLGAEASEGIAAFVEKRPPIWPA